MWDSVSKYWKEITGVLGVLVAVTAGLLKAVKDALSIRELRLKIENLERGLQEVGVVLPATVEELEGTVKRASLIEKVNSGTLNTLLIVGLGLALFGLYTSERETTEIALLREERERAMADILTAKAEVVVTSREKVNEIVSALSSKLVQELLKDDTFRGQIAAAAQEVGARVEALERLAVPVGTILSFAGPVEKVPAGWLPCDGRKLPRRTDDGTDTELFNQIGTAWGEGDGKDTFHLPQLGGHFLRGYTTRESDDPGIKGRSFRNIGGATGANVGSYQGDAVGPHDHGPPPGTMAYWAEHPTSAGSNLGGPGTATVEEAARRTGKNTGSETRPKNAYVLFIIKAE